jgi:hypothetical protein
MQVWRGRRRREVEACAAARRSQRTTSRQGQLWPIRSVLGTSILARSDRSPSERTPGSPMVTFSSRRASPERVVGQHCMPLPQGQDFRTRLAIRARTYRPFQSRRRHKLRDSLCALSSTRHRSDGAGVEPAFLPNDPREKFKWEIVLGCSRGNRLTQRSQIRWLPKTSIRIRLYRLGIQSRRRVDRLTVVRAVRCGLWNLGLHRKGNH